MHVCLQIDDVRDRRVLICRRCAIQAVHAGSSMSLDSATDRRAWRFDLLHAKRGDEPKCLMESLTGNCHQHASQLWLHRWQPAGSHRCTVPPPLPCWFCGLHLILAVATCAHICLEGRMSQSIAPEAELRRHGSAARGSNSGLRARARTSGVDCFGSSGGGHVRSRGPRNSVFRKGTTGGI